MGRVAVEINNTDVSSFIETMGSLSEHSDENEFFTGVFRRSNIQITFNNQSGQFNEGLNSVFSGSRNNVPVKIYYIDNNTKLGKTLVFSGVLDEGSSTNNLTAHTISFLIVDYLKLIDDVSIEQGNAKSVENSLKLRLNTEEVNLDAEYIKEFLDFVINKGSLSLTYDIAISIGSAFVPDDAYYDAINTGALSILIELVQSTNSYFTSSENKISIKPRSLDIGSKLIANHDILSIENQTRGYNKIYNSIKINNGSKSYVNQTSIDEYGLRELAIRSYAAPSQNLADSYLDFFSIPREEFNLSLRLNFQTLSYDIGDVIEINLQKNRDNSIQEKIGKFYILTKNINFQSEKIDLRMRGI